MAIWLIKIINTSELSLKKTNLSLPLILFSLFLVLSLFLSNSKIISLQELIIFLSYIILFFLVINHVFSKNDFNGFIYLFFILSFIVSAYTLIQYYGFDPYLGDLGKLTSTIGQKNWISNYLAIVFPLVFSYFVLEKNKNNKRLYFVLLAIIYTTLLICQSRGIWISIVLTIIFALLIIYKYKLISVFKSNKKWLIALLIVFLVITTIYSTENPLNKSRLTVAERALSTLEMSTDTSINARFLMWKVAIEMFKDNPFFGLGIGTFKYHYLDYQAEYLLSNPNYIKNAGKAAEAHNEYLQMAAEIGIIGLGIFLTIFVLLYKEFWLFFKQEEDLQKKIIAWGMLLGITCFLLHSLFTFPLHVPALASMFFVFLGLSVTYINNFNLPEVKIKTDIKHFSVKLLLTIFVLILMIMVINSLVIKPYVAELYYFTGMRYNVDRNYEKSVPKFEFAAKLDPYNGRILHALGTTYKNLKMYSEAEDVLKSAKEYIVDVNTYRNLGLVYVNASKTEKAIEEFEQAIYLDPKFWEAYNDLASLYIYQGEYEKAIETWQKVIYLGLEFKEKHIFLYYIGMAYQKMNDTDKAYNYFKKALKEAPDDSPIMEDIEQELLKIFQSTNVSE
jgi:O-antigen ligase